MWIYTLYRLAGLLLPRIPSRLGYWLCARLGDLAYHLGGEARRNVRHNLRHVLGEGVGEEAIERRVREVFRNQVKNYFDLFRVPRLRPADLEGRLTVHGLEHIDQALTAGKGVILVSGHFGNFDIVGQILAFRSYHVTIVAEHLQPEPLYQYICRLRASQGLRLIPVDGSLKAIFKALRRNELVALAADRDVTESGIVVDFFGAPAQLPDGYAQLARRTGARIVLGFSARCPDNTYFAYVEPPLEAEVTGDRERDVRVTVEKVVALMERYLREHPEQWVMFQPLWNLVLSSRRRTETTERR
jgi:lauroyl/myristoyl acyltransferase